MLIAKMREGTRTNIHKNGKISRRDNYCFCISGEVINYSMFKNLKNHTIQVGGAYDVV